MISPDECRKYLGEKVTDIEVEALRSVVYTFVEHAMDFIIQSGTLVSQRHEEK